MTTYFVYRSLDPETATPLDSGWYAVQDGQPLWETPDLAEAYALVNALQDARAEREYYDVIPADGDFNAMYRTAELVL